jgi:hypothetical protein
MNTLMQKHMSQDSIQHNYDDDWYTSIAECQQ